MTISNDSIHRPTVADTALEHLALDEADLRERVGELEGDVVTYRSIAVEAIHALHQLTQQVRRVRDENRHLRAQVRAAVSGRTIAEERQTLDDEATDADDGHGARRAA